MSRGVKFTKPPELIRWRMGFGRLARELASEHGPWRQATDLMFDRSQQYVHVISADLKSSGRSRVFNERDTIVGEIIYGNSTVDYAQTEIDRGGDHDFMGRAWESTEAVFSAALPKVWTKVVGGWG